MKTGNVFNVPQKALSYTSRGNKLVFHPEQIDSFLNKSGNSIISAHIAPTNKCNLNCSYCNQSLRDKSKFLDIETIQDFILKLKERGLKAAIITGGGEPTLYPDFNKLTNWIKEQGLKSALITNGTNDMAGKEKINVWDNFTWVRASLNFDKQGKMFPLKIPQINGDLGFSMVFGNHSLEAFKGIKNVADNLKAKYVRILPDCTLSAEEIQKQYEKLHEITIKLNDDRFFIQSKIPEQAKIKTCHQSKLRPFLQANGQVAPCDCYMLQKNESGQAIKKLPDNYNLAPNGPQSYLDYLDGKFEHNFNPQTDCNFCAFVNSNEILENLIKLKENDPNAKAIDFFERMGLDADESTQHKEFI